MSHVAAESCCADLPLLRLVRANASAATWCRRHNHSACIAVRMRACLMAHPPKHAHGASCVETNDSFRSELIALAYTCILGTPLPGALPSRSVFGRVVTNATTDHKLSCEMTKNHNLPVLIEKTETHHSWVTRRHR